MQEISIFNSEANLVTYQNARDVAKFGAENAPKHAISQEAALFKGGAALKQLKDQALLSAANKAASGRYRAAADIIAVAFPKQHKAFVGFLSCEPWANASKMSLFLEKCEDATAGKNGWTAKQHSARALMQAMREAIPALASDRAHQVIEA